MKNKKKSIIITVIIFIILIIFTLWISGVIPKEIAKISATQHFRKYFPKIQMRYENIEWADSFGSYIIQFKDQDNTLHGFCIGPKYFPINLGQGMFAFEENYREKYNQSEEKSNQKYVDLENVPLDYDFAQMVEDKCYIASSGIYHKEELDNFIKNVENKVSDEIRIVRYTIEGQPVLINLEYINNKFIVKTDNRRDGYASAEDKKIITNEYDATEYKFVKENASNEITKLKTYYSLVLKSTKTSKTIPICTYVEVKQTSNEKFEIRFNKKLGAEEITQILGKEESNKYDYNIYSYKGTVDILIDGEKMSLREALLNNQITVEDILNKANKDEKEEGTIYGAVYLDGGSRMYLYNDYQILKCNTLEGNKDLYIGVPSMNINDILK